MHRGCHRRVQALFWSRFPAGVPQEAPLQPANLSRPADVHLTSVTQIARDEITLCNVKTNAEEKMPYGLCLWSAGGVLGGGRHAR
jgi:hypothetical protein